MGPLREAMLTLLAIGAVISLAAIASALHEFRTGRLVRYPFHRRVPATPEDIRKNGLALVLNDLGVLLADFIVLSGLLLEGARFDLLLGLSCSRRWGRGIRGIVPLDVHLTPPTGRGALCEASEACFGPLG